MPIYLGTSPITKVYLGGAIATMFSGALPLLGAFVTKLITTAFSTTSRTLPSSPLIGTVISDSSVTMTPVGYSSSYTPIPLPSSPLIGTPIATFREG